MISLLNKLDLAATELTIAAEATNDPAKLKKAMAKVANDLRGAYELGSDQWTSLRKAVEFLEKGKR